MVSERKEQKRQERAQRILDAAAVLILRWGYNKTTIDDIAREAGVAKGTIYLHWNTREELFSALMRRERALLSEEVRRRVADDPAGATLRSMMRHSALALLGRPLLKAVLLRDMDVIGKLAHGEEHSANYTQRMTGMQAYLEVLREHGLVRTDQSVRVQLYLLGAVAMGSLLLAPLMPDDWTLSDEELADLIADTVERTLAADQAAPAEAAQGASDALMRYLERGVALSNEQYQRALQQSQGSR